MVKFDKQLKQHIKPYICISDNNAAAAVMLFINSTGQSSSSSAGAGPPASCNVRQEAM